MANGTTFSVLHSHIDEDNSNPVYARALRRALFARKESVGENPRDFLKALFRIPNDPTGSETLTSAQLRSGLQPLNILNYVEDGEDYDSPAPKFIKALIAEIDASRENAISY